MPTPLTAEQIEQIRGLRAQGKASHQIAMATGLAHSTVRRHLAIFKQTINRGHTVGRNAQIVKDYVVNHLSIDAIERKYHLGNSTVRGVLNHSAVQIRHRGPNFQVVVPQEVIEATEKYKAFGYCGYPPCLHCPMHRFSQKNTAVQNKDHQLCVECTLRLDHDRANYYSVKANPEAGSHYINYKAFHP